MGTAGLGPDALTAHTRGFKYIKCSSLIYIEVPTGLNGQKAEQAVAEVDLSAA